MPKFSLQILFIFAICKAMELHEKKFENSEAITKGPTQSHLL